MWRYGFLILPCVSSRICPMGNLLFTENMLILFLPQVTSGFPPGKLSAIREIHRLAGRDFSRDFVCSLTHTLAMICTPPIILVASLVSMPTVPFLEQLLIRPHHFSDPSGDGGETCLTAVEGKRSMAMVILDDVGRQQQSSLTMVAATSSNSNGRGWSARLFDHLNILPLFFQSCNHLVSKAKAMVRFLTSSRDFLHGACKKS